MIEYRYENGIFFGVFIGNFTERYWCMYVLSLACLYCFFHTNTYGEIKE